MHAISVWLCVILHRRGNKHQNGQLSAQFVVKRSGSRSPVSREHRPMRSLATSRIWCRLSRQTEQWLRSRRGPTLSSESRLCQANHFRIARGTQHPHSDPTILRRGQRERESMKNGRNGLGVHSENVQLGEAWPNQEMSKPSAMSVLVHVWIYTKILFCYCYLLIDIGKCMSWVCECVYVILHRRGNNTQNGQLNAQFVVKRSGSRSTLGQRWQCHAYVAAFPSNRAITWRSSRRPTVSIERNRWWKQWKQFRTYLRDTVDEGRLNRSQVWEYACEWFCYSNCWVYTKIVWRIFISLFVGWDWFDIDTRYIM